MIQKLKSKLAIFAALLTLAAPLAVPMSASAGDIQGNLCKSAKDLTISPDDQNGSKECTETNNGNNVNALIEKTINVLSAIIGVIAVIMIIYGGFRYITSGGSQDKVTSAKNTLLYAIIGLVVVALAQIIVRFVLHNVT